MMLDYVEIYFNPEISFSSLINCDDPGVPFDSGNYYPKWGKMLVDGTDFTITNNGDGTPDVLVVSMVAS